MQKGKKRLWQSYLFSREALVRGGGITSRLSPMQIVLKSHSSKYLWKITSENALSVSQMEFKGRAVGQTIASSHDLTFWAECMVFAFMFVERLNSLSYLFRCMKYPTVVSKSWSGFMPPLLCTHSCLSLSLRLCDPCEFDGRFAKLWEKAGWQVQWPKSL